MSKTAFNLIIWAIVLIVAQAVVFNHICLWGFAVPFAFLYILLRLPLSLSKEWAFTIAFAVGLTIDVFSDTPGLNALSCTVLMALRRPVVRMYVPRGDELPTSYPSAKAFGAFTFMKYAFTMSLIYCIMVFMLEAFSVYDSTRLLISIASSAVLTTIIVICIDSLTAPRREKGL